jgi:hypothetical protein
MDALWRFFILKMSPLSQKLLMKSRLLGVNIDGPFQGNFLQDKRRYVIDAQGAILDEPSAGTVALN